MLPHELQCMQALGYAVFDGGPYDLNVVGVRRNPAPDVLHVIYLGEHGQWITETYPVTTDPTVHWLRHPMRGDGTAIMVPQQYRGLWRPGVHRPTRRPSLVQIGECMVWRDNNRDDVVDLQPGERGIPGLYGINLHSGRGARASAGCQVLPKQDQVDRILRLVERQRRHGFGSSVSYTLLTPKDLAR